MHLENDIDEQLFLYISFNEVLKLHSLNINGLLHGGLHLEELFLLLENLTFFMLTKVLVPKYMYIQILSNLTWYQDGIINNVVQTFED